MKNQLLKIMLLLLSLGVAIGCSKDDAKEENGNPVDPNFTLFTNQTGDPDADALQGIYTGELNDYKVNFYGTFNADGEPTDINTITYQKTNNDTIVNYLLNPVTKRLASSFVTVNNIKSNYVTKYDYPEDNPGAVTISMYNYGWIGQSSELLFTANIEKDADAPPVDKHFRVKSTGFSNVLAAVATGVAIAEGVAAYNGTFSGIAYLAGLAAPVVTAGVATIVIATIGVGVIVFVASALLNSAHASELNPKNMPYPPKVQVNNPAIPNSIPLPIPECINTRMTFSATMDGEGSIMIWGVNGGSGNYSYMVNSTYQQTEVFSNNYPDGEYLVAVKDGNGCVSAKKVTLSRNLPPAAGWFVGHYTLDGPNYPLHGQSGEIYIYYFNSADGAGPRAYVYYVKSITPEMPNFYHSSAEIIAENVGWSIGTFFVGPYTTEFSLQTYNHGTYMDAYVPPNNATNPLNRLKRFEGEDAFQYSLGLYADFSASVPAGLTQANIDQIYALRPTVETGGATVEE